MKRKHRRSSDKSGSSGRRDVMRVLVRERDESKGCNLKERISSLTLQMQHHTGSIYTSCPLCAV